MKLSKVECLMRNTARQARNEAPRSSTEANPEYTVVQKLLDLKITHFGIIADNQNIFSKSKEIS